MPDSSAPEVIFERHNDGTATIRINRPQARNALNMTTREALAEICRQIAEDSTLRAIIVTGGPEVFVAGADLKDFAAIDAITLYKRKTEKLWQAITEVPQPMIAAVNGFALGGGLELALACDIIIAGDSAQFAAPEVKVGILPGAGGSQRLTRAVGKYQAMRMVLTGDMISADNALRMGLVSEVVADDLVYETAKKMARKIAHLPPIAVQQAKETILLGADAALSTAMALERKAFQLSFATKDKQEGMNAFLEKRKADFKGE